MKSLRIITALVLATIFTSCSDDDDVNKITISTNETPAAITTYKNTHFPNNSVLKTIKDTEDNTVTYKMYLDGNIELEFNSAYQIIDIDATSKLPDSVIPAAILTYVTQNYASNYITDWELEASHQQVELNNGVDLEFNLDGTFIRVD